MPPIRENLSVAASAASRKPVTGFCWRLRHRRHVSQRPISARSSSVRQCGRSSRPNASARPIPFHPLKAFDVASTTAAYRVLDRFGFS